MEWRLLVYTALILFALGSSPIVNGQTCSITGIDIDLASSPSFIDNDALVFTIEGNVEGGTPSTITWTRNTFELTPHFSSTLFPGGNGAKFFVGGDTTSSSTCSNLNFRVAVQINGRAPGTYSVTVSNSGGSASDSIVIQGSNPVTGLTLTQFDDVRLNASWTPPVNTESDVVLNYRVFIDNQDFNSETDGAQVAFGTNIFTLPGMYNPDTTVTVHVRATTMRYWSTTVSVSYQIVGVLAPIVTPSVTPTSVALFLSQNSTPSVLPNQYRAILTAVDCSNAISPQTMMATGNSITFDSNVEAGIRYTASVTATNTVYSSSSTTTVTVTTGETAPSGSPDSLLSIDVTSTSITLSWTEIDCIQRNGQIVNYIIRYGEGTNRNLMVDTQSTSLIYEVPNLKPFTNYTFTVEGATIVGSGPASASVVRKTAQDRPTEVRELTVTPGLTSVSLTWRQPDPPNGIITHYTITYAVNGSSPMTNTTTSTNFKIGRLPAKTVVSVINVTASTKIGAGPGVTHASVTIPDGLPQIQNVTVTVLTATSVRVSWNDPQFSSISYYEIKYTLVESRRRQEMTGSGSVNASASATSVDITNLMNNREYMFQVIAVALLDGEILRGQPSMMVNVLVMPTTDPPPVISGGNPAVPIAVGVVLGIIAVLAVIAFIVIIVYLQRTGRLHCGSGVSKSAPITSYRYAPDNVQSDNPYYSNSNDTFAPVIEEFPDNTTAIEGEEIIFKVHVSGKPSPVLKWTFSGKEIFTNYAITVSDDGTLTFPSAELDQSGVYELVAENSAGSTQREVKLNVEKEADDGIPDLNKESLEIKAIPVDQFGEYVAGNHSNNNRGFRDQFQGLYDGEDKTKTIGLSPEFKKMNRFANITVYDDNRIELAALPMEGCDGPFINACYVDGFSKPKKFIASQGPIPRTLVDFWRMIWQERPPTIVMVTNLKEGNKNKCQQYWPDTGSTTFGPFKVMITENIVLADYVIRTLQVSLEGANRPFKLTQFHFTAWPDHGVPDYATPMLAFHRRVISSHKGKKGPILVHCSAGVGRTGTFICIDCILEQIKKENVVDIAGSITRIRHQRMKMVQTPDQYVFLHDAILESVRCGDTQISAANLRVVLHKYNKKDPQTGLTTFQSQFDVLDQVSPKISDVVCTAATRNQEKNRSMKYLPSDRFRVIIKGEAEDYIHASFAHGYKQQKAYIIAENPMASTVPNVLKILYNRKCGTVVMLSALEENGQEVCSRYWPNLNEMARFGDFVVDLISEEVLPGFTMRNISILHEKSRKAHQVMQFHITCWQPDGQCSSLRSVVDTIEEIAKVQRKTGNKPIFVHCSDTITRSGMFCALATIIDRCKTEGVVDVFQVVKALRIQKPGAVPTVHDYRTIFEATLTFLDSFDTYANFQN